MLSGGSLVSTSVTSVLSTCTAQVVPPGRSAVGLSVKTLVPPGAEGESAKGMSVPAGHSILKVLAVTLTFSLKVTVMLADGSAPLAPLVGVVAVTVGAASTLSVTVAVESGVCPLVMVYWKVSEPSKPEGGV